jgi:fructose-bisphosphate aldolase, class II
MPSDIGLLMRRALARHLVIPAFNIAYLPMLEPVVEALRDANALGQIAAARPDWEKFGAGSPAAVAAEYQRWRDDRHTRLHLDHVPVIDEDGQPVEYLPILRAALDLGYDSVMVDASRLPLPENIACTQQVTALAHERGVPVEAELGAVLGHETGPLPPYEELFASGRGFTDPSEAALFVKETSVDWLSVAVGNVHGALSDAARGQKKVAARLDLEHLARLADHTGLPLVLHGGTGIEPQYIRAGIRAGIAKINIATAIRQPYEAKVTASVAAAQESVYETTLALLTDELELTGSAPALGL